MKQIPLTDGFVTVVDDEDFERLSQYSWQVQHHGRTQYARTTVYPNGSKITIRMHRFITGCDKRTKIDHRDGNGLNNQRKNLRFATPTQNNRNARLRKDNTTGFKGVHFKKSSRKFQAYITVDKVRMTLGCFETPEEAHAVYCAAAQKHFGAFARFQ